MSELGKTYKIRDFKEEDRAFVMSTWLRGLYYGNGFFAVMPKDVFMENYKKYLDLLINKSVIKIACLVDDEDTILGYSVLSTDLAVLHWIFIKKLFRQKGVARTLCPSNLKYFSHFTDLGLQLKNKLNGAVFNPFAL